MCKSPLKGFVCGTLPSGKRDLSICSYSVDHIEIDSQGHRKPAESSFRSPYAVRCITEFIEIPCGRCVECRLKYARDWANRCMFEIPYHDSAYFCTFTYDDDHIPVHEYVDNDGVINDVFSLEKKDFQDFMKRLRERQDDKLSYFACGEYGGQTFRPHFHAIIYGLKLDDLKFYKKNINGDNLYISKFLDSVWQNGISVIGEVNYQTASYVARYVLKKQYGNDAKVYDELNIQRPFTLSSRRPAIGKQWFDDHHGELYEYDYIPVPNGEKPIKFYGCRYYDNKLEEFDDFDLDEIKNQKIARANQVSALKSLQTSNNYITMLANEAKNMESRVSSLRQRKEV